MTSLRVLSGESAIETKVYHPADKGSSPRSPEVTLWPWIAVATLILVAAAMIRWSFTHPFGIHWDEALYINEATIDAQRLHHGMLFKLGGRILLKSWGRPPAYRLLALPFVAILPLSAVTLRFVSLTCFALSAWLLYGAISKIAGRGAACLGVLVYVLSPEVIAASSFFGTDAPLYLATAAMLYSLCAGWTEKREENFTWILLGLALALGMLSKASFLVIALPALTFFLFVELRSVDRPKLKPAIKAIGLATVLAGPWWLLNVKGVVEYSKYARGFVRNSLGPPSIGTLLRWLNTAWQCLLGHGVAVIVALLIVYFIAKFLLDDSKALTSLDWKVIGLCVCAASPIVIIQLLGTNHLLRHVSPAVIPFAMAIGVIAGRTGFTRSPLLSLAAVMLFAAQLVLIVYPVVRPNREVVDLGFVNGVPAWRALARFDQWDWASLRDLSDRCGLVTPRISYVGGGRELNPEAIQYPWISRAASTGDSVLNFPNVSWLWRYEDGVMDWQKLIAAAESSDIVLTAPDYIGEARVKENLDNQYNAEFSRRVAALPEFRGPIHLSVGRFDAITIDVFLRKNLVCQ